MPDELKPPKQLAVEYGPWQRAKTVLWEGGASMTTMEYMTEDALRARLAEAVGLLGVSHRMVDTDEHRAAVDDFLARVEEGK